MTDPTTTASTDAQTAQEAQVVQKDNFVVRFTNNHPRAAKVLAITGGIGTAVGAALLVGTVKSNKDHLDSAGEHAKEAVSELGASVTPGDTEA